MHRKPLQQVDPASLDLFLFYVRVAAVLFVYLCAPHDLQVVLMIVTYTVILLKFGTFERTEDDVVQSTTQNVAQLFSNDTTIADAVTDSVF